MIIFQGRFGASEQNVINVYAISSYKKKTLFEGGGNESVHRKRTLGLNIIGLFHAFY